MKKIFYLLITQLMILIAGTFLQQKGFINLQEFYAFSIAPVAIISGLLIRNVFLIRNEK